MSVDKTLPFKHEALESIAEQYGTPVFVYDEAGIRQNTQTVNEAFGWSVDYVNHFAVKATPTPGVLRVIEDEGMGFDCSSRPELVMLQQEGLGSNGLFYTSNNTPDADYQLANEMGAVINIDKLPYLRQVQRALGVLPTSMAIRFNPGNQKTGNDIIGDPVKSKFGDTADNVVEALRQMHEGGVEKLGLHAMVVSNEKDPESFAGTAKLLRQLTERILAECGLSVAFINVGGGLGVNYHPDEEPVDVPAIGQAVRSQLEDLGIPVVTEHGRYITGPHGYLLTRVTHGIVETYEPYVQVDTSINNMARLATVTAAYHQIDVLGRQGDPTKPMNVTGSMCANTDKMFKGYELPVTIEPGDLMVIHDAGAHSRANSHNYNFRLRAGEVLVHPDGSTQLIRRHETIEDLFATTQGL
jgi:diaminopimelate decarboxylase